MIEFDEQAFVKHIEQEQAAALIQFWAPWCVYCLLWPPRMEQLEQWLDGDVLIGQLNTETSADIARRQGIEYVPAVAWFTQGQMQNVWYGDTEPREIFQFIREQQARLTAATTI